MLNQPMSPGEAQSAQLLMAVTLAVFVGVRFVPSSFRYSVGLMLTVCYGLGVAGFMVYLLFFR